MEGVLRSWAVPKGPSYNTSDKRLAVMVEDHPLEYGDFEGIIPEGNYGAGAVIVWDRGQWLPTGDPTEGLESGKLLFELRGIKLRGMWTLVKLKKSQNDWLLIKERDEFASSSGEPVSAQSVLSGLTVEELKAGRTPAASIRSELQRLSATVKAVRPDEVKLMLAEPRDRPFSAPGWVFELKLDGYRALASRESKPRLLSRNRNDLSDCFPEIIKALSALPYERLLLDGEVVALDSSGRPNFQRLQQRGRLSRALDIRVASVENPVTYYAFDVLGIEDFDLRMLPLTTRKALLQKLLPGAGIIRYLDHFVADGEVLYQEVQKLGLEGIVGKRGDSPYKAGRSAGWVKIRSRRSDDFVVVGFTAPKGTRSGFGALQLGLYIDGVLTYCGRAGSGFSDAQLAEVRKQLDGASRKEPGCVGTLPQEKGNTWVNPRLVCEVEFTEWTDEGLLRQPVFLRFRDDKGPEECVASGRVAHRPSGEAEVAQPPTAEPAREERSFTLTNPDKVFWPDEGYTKGDLLEYYRSISPWMLPYLVDRPLVLTRFPDGIAGKSFYQQDAPAFVPQWIRTQRMYSEQAQREISYFIGEDEAALLYLVNLGTIPFHVWASRTSRIDRPDWCVLDLDPKGAPFSDVVRTALTAHQLCDEIGLPNYIKTSGSSGLHVLIPLGCQCRFDEARSLGELLARLIVGEIPEITTLARQISRREGKVYVDYLQNGSGRLIVAPFSARPLPGAPVSMPLLWSEVKPGLDIRAFTIRNALDRMRQLKQDPLVPVVSDQPDLAAALDRLGKRGSND